MSRVSPCALPDTAPDLSPRPGHRLPKAPPAAPAAAPASPQIQLIPASPEGALDAAEEAVDLL
ncbi:hypothetical protein JHN46_45060, partial [Streptomyces sp. MBT33]|nr:hypothetical protein [Streptomyces sp. MBT33]